VALLGRDGGQGQLPEVKHLVKLTELHTFNW